MALAGSRSGFSLDITSFLTKITAAKKEYDRWAAKAIKLGALLYVREIKKTLSLPGTGRARKVKGRKGVRGGTTRTGRAKFRVVGGSNRASAPGNPPAVDTGRLRSSITYEIERQFLVFVAKVGTDIEYAKILEFGGHTGRGHATFIAARPYMLTTLERIKPELNALFQRVLSGG